MRVNVPGNNGEGPLPDLLRLGPDVTQRGEELSLVSDALARGGGTYDRDERRTNAEGDEKTRARAGPDLDLHALDQSRLSLSVSFLIRLLVALDECRLDGVRLVEQVLHEREQDGDDNGRLESFAEYLSERQKVRGWNGAARARSRTMKKSGTEKSLLISAILWRVKKNAERAGGHGGGSGRCRRWYD